MSSSTPSKLIRGKNSKIYMLSTSSPPKKKNLEKKVTNYKETNNLNTKVIQETNKYLYSKKQNKYAKFQIFKSEDGSKKYYLTRPNGKLINYTSDDNIINIPETTKQTFYKKSNRKIFDAHKITTKNSKKYYSNNSPIYSPAAAGLTPSFKLINYTSNNNIINNIKKEGNKDFKKIKVYDKLDKKIRNIKYNSHTNKIIEMNNQFHSLRHTNIHVFKDTNLLNFLLSQGSTDSNAKTLYVSTDNFDAYLFDGNFLYPVIELKGGKLYAVKDDSKKKTIPSELNLTETKNFNNANPNTEYYFKKFSADQIVMYHINDVVIKDDDPKQNFKIKSFVERTSGYYAILIPGKNSVSIDRLRHFDPIRDKTHNPALYRLNESVYRRDNVSTMTIPDVYKIKSINEENIMGNHKYIYKLIDKNGKDAGEYLEEDIKNLEKDIAYWKLSETTTGNKFTFGIKDTLGLEGNFGYNHFAVGDTVYIKNDGISKKYKIISANRSIREIEDINDRSMRIKMNKKYLEKISDKVNKGNIVQYTNTDGKTKKKGKILSSESGSVMTMDPRKWFGLNPTEERQIYYTIEGARGRKFTARELVKNIEATYGSKSTSSSTLFLPKFKKGNTVQYKNPITRKTEVDIITDIQPIRKKTMFGTETNTILGYKYKTRRRSNINERSLEKA